MIQVLWNVIKYFLGIFQRMLYPLKRLICRRRKLSISEDTIELMSVGTGDGYQINTPISGSLPQNDADLEMESWDNWGDSLGHQQQNIQSDHDNYHNNSTPSINGDVTAQRGGHHHQSHRNLLHEQHRRKVEPEQEPDINFFEDMTPDVRRQKKFLIRKNDAKDTSQYSNRLTVMSDIPVQSSELESWEDSGSTWEDNAEGVEDISWQADEAIREQKKRERIERQMEQQRKKLRKEEMRGGRVGGSLAATKLS